MDVELAAAVSQLRSGARGQVSTPAAALEGESMRPEEHKRGVRRTALWMSLLAFAFYAGFILMSVLRAG